MLKYKKWMEGILLFPLILIFMNVETASAQSSTNYQIKKFVLDQGGAPSQSVNHKVVDAVGQPSAVGIASSTNYKAAAGFFMDFQTRTISWNLSQGWHMISLPVIPADNSLTTLFPTALAAYSFDPSRGVYVTETVLNPKKGYWLLIPATTTSTITGTPLTSYTGHYDVGWHLIGTTIGTSLPFADPDDNPDGSVIAVYGWDPIANTYYQVYPSGTGVLNEKEAYWLAVVTACDLTIPGVPPLSEGVIDEAAWKEFTEIYGSKPPAQPFITNKETAQSLPMENWLSYNYPNPFNPITTIAFALPKSSKVTLKIFDILGKEITTLVDDELQPGEYKVVFNAQGLSSGIYFYTFLADQFVCQRKLVLIK